MSLKDSLWFHVSFSLALIPIQFKILSFLLFSLIYKLLGIDPAAQSVFPSLASLPWSKRGVKKPCPYASPYASEKKWDAYPYKPPGLGDVRSPCPALNTMANHGYIPHDGKNLTGTMLTHALMECYNLSWPLAAFLAWGGVLLLGQVGTLSLQDLARHNRIEHDASITHENTPQGEEYAPMHSSPELYDAFLRDARKDKFAAKDIARARVRREKESGEVMTAVQQEIARGEVALVLQIFGGFKFAVPVEVVHSWWRDERLPENWKPTRKTTLLGTVYWSTQIRHWMDRMRDGVDVEEVPNKKKLMNGNTSPTRINGNIRELAPMDRMRNGYATPSTNGALELSPAPVRKASIPVSVAA